MTDTLTTPASPSFEKLKAKLAELFELDKADLDFGIYRVLRQRHAEISEFLDKHLAKAVNEALASHATDGQAQVKQDLEDAIKAVKLLKQDPDQNPTVQELKEKLKEGGDLDALADEVYSHLLTFFSRYYQEGDFLGLQRSTVHGREKYMIPYNGEEVKLVWANMDQFYIKSSDLLRDYTFHLYSNPEGLFKGDPGETRTVHFILVEGDTEKDNRLADTKTTRAFFLDETTLFELVSPEELQIRFRYREHKSERNLQDKVNVETVKILADTLPEPWDSILFAADPTYQGKDKKDIRNILQKHLRGYTARHQFDYFIHKDLGGFLRRELDFYLKNEVMHLDDIEEDTAPKAEEYLSKLRAIRRCAMPVIRMLTQLEEFQKKLWLKKKFVVETRYCMTLDRVPEDLYQEVCANAAQWEEWEKLYTLSETPETITKAKPGTMAFLKAQPYMVLDTRHFESAFALKLLASVDSLDEALDGVCFHSENFQALKLMQERYQDQVKCVYIDPPYNTSSSAILYKNSYKHSSWGSLMLDRVALLRETMKPDGAIFVSIDKGERTLLEASLDLAFGEDNHIEELIWTQNTANSQLPNYSTNHEYVEVYSKDRRAAESDKGMFRESKPGYAEVMHLIETINPDFPPLADIEKAIKAIYQEHIAEYKEELEAAGREWNEESEKQDPWKGIYNYCKAEYRDEKGGLVLEEEAKDKGAFIWVWREISPAAPAAKQAKSTKDPEHFNYRYYKPLHRTTKKPCPHPRSGWKFPLNPDPENPSRRSFVELDLDSRISWGDDENKVPQTKGFLHEVETNIGTSVFYAYNDGEAEVASLFGESGVFLSPKSSSFVKKFVNQTTRKNDVVVDVFGGSGSTAHAVIAMNMEDQGKRKYVTAEMGMHFETVMIPRLKKVSYSPNWKEGKPVDRNSGISHAFKILRLESYEDTLNNLHIHQSGAQKAVLQHASEAQQDEYTLGYFLEVETAGSPSMLDVTHFRDPFNYKLQIATRSAGETKPTNVDLVETFNWLLGLKVKHVDHLKGFLTVTGERRAGGRVLVIWRTLGDDVTADNKALEGFLEKITVNPADTEFEAIYINGSHTLSDPHNKVHLIEEVFQRRMFENDSFATLIQ